MDTPQFETLAQSLTLTLQNLEMKRQDLKKQGHTSGIWAGGIFFAIGTLFSLYIHAGFIGVGIAAVMSAFIYYTCVNTKSQELSAYYKQEVIAEVLQSFCENAAFLPQHGIKESIFRNCNLFTSPDRYHTEDLIKGQVGKTEFCCAEVHAEEKRTTVDSKGRTSQYWVDIFKGFLFIADFHKDFRGHTIVQRNRLFKLSFGSSRVKLENPDFEKTFDVYSTDQIEARYLLTPSMMERLLALEAQFHTGIMISFQNSNILIAIPDSKNHFEANIWKSISHPSQLKEDFSTIQALVSIIEDLNLNTRIWTKD